MDYEALLAKLEAFKSVTDVRENNVQAGVAILNAARAIRKLMEENAELEKDLDSVYAEHSGTLG